MGVTIVKETWYCFRELVSMIDILHTITNILRQEKEAQSILVPEKWHILLSCVMNTWSLGYGRHIGNGLVLSQPIYRKKLQATNWCD